MTCRAIAAYMDRAGPMHSCTSALRPPVQSVVPERRIHKWGERVLNPTLPNPVLSFPVWL
jgi:hypothetical protein